MTMKETTVKINSKYVNRMKSGYPLISKEAIINVNDLVGKRGPLSYGRGWKKYIYCQRLLW